MDDLRAFGFNSEYQRHRSNARLALEAAKRHLDSLVANFDGEPSSTLTYDARHLVAAGSEFWAEIQAALALHEVRFVLADEPGAKEAGSDD